VQESLGIVDIDVERNAYGRQIHSRVARIRFQDREIEAVFIRAPVIRRTGPGVTVLARYEGDPVLVRQGRHVVATFHPELSAGCEIQRDFLNRIRSLEAIA
jgi:5'-phosphate synthase pdxT subunit